ncbi:MAG: hypothetical protein ABSH53_06085 [Holophaga sp.]|jgi:hypothetical protein
MRLHPAILFLIALPACAQGVENYFYLDAHYFTPDISGHFNNLTGSNPINVDLKNDLALTKGTTKVGFGAEYQGHRFGLELSRDEQDYKGQNTLNRTITVNGQQFAAGVLVTSTFKATNNNLNWTIRAYSGDTFWAGLDLGARYTQAEINVFGINTPTGFTVSADYKTPLPVPQIGPSLGIVAANGRVVAKGFFHFLTYKGATYTHYGADLRVFPVNWLGVRAFLDGEHFKVPANSIKSDLDVGLDRTGTGLGVVVRF